MTKTLKKLRIRTKILMDSQKDKNVLNSKMQGIMSHPLPTISNALENGFINGSIVMIRTIQNGFSRNRKDHCCHLRRLPQISRRPLS